MERSNILYTTLILESKETSQNVKLIDVFVAFSLSCPVSSLPEERVQCCQYFPTIGQMMDSFTMMLLILANTTLSSSFVKRGEMLKSKTEVKSFYDSTICCSVLTHLIMTFALTQTNLRCIGSQQSKLLQFYYPGETLGQELLVFDAFYPFCDGQFVNYFL